MTSHLDTTHLSADDEIAVLTPEAVGQLRVPWDARFSQRELAEIARARPALSVWNQRSGEFLIGGLWRRRQDIAGVVELSASGGAIDLIDAFCLLARRQDMTLVVASEQVERRRSSFYVHARLEPIEDIIIYEMTRVRSHGARSGSLVFTPLDMQDQAMRDELIRLDHAAFPWLWWNSGEEFAEYASAPGVRIDIASDDSGRAIAYVGTTRFRSWGHLDRIAVDPTIQGQGLGRIALDYAVSSLAAAGASRIGLSTQLRNSRSRALYESYGFRRSTSHDYRVYGRLLDSSRRMEELVG